MSGAGASMTFLTALHRTVAFADRRRSGAVGQYPDPMWRVFENFSMHTGVAERGHWRVI